MRHPFEGIGKPEALRENLSGFWSRRIDDTHRIVYTVEDNDLAIIVCRYHYE
jgi:toxin YoeB